MDSAKEIWSDILSILEVELTTFQYDAWIKPLEPICIAENKLVVLVVAEGNKEFIRTHFKVQLMSALKRVNPLVTDILLIEKDELEDYRNKTEEEVILEDPEPEPAPSLLNPKYLFENFVVGKCNQFVHAAAEAVAGEPGTRYNPFVIYGGVGLGKTHLMHAIGNEIRLNKPKLKVLYVSSEKFINEFIESIRTTKGKNTNFRNRYRSVDVLMIDDIQFISGKTATQEELFHTFNEMYDANKQLIFASDRPLKDIPELEDRLRSRFEWGLTADIQPPDIETRIAILQKKAQMLRYNMPLDVLTFMAESVTSNIREMEGLLNKVIFLSKLEEKEPSVELVREVLRETNDTPLAIPNVTENKIISAVCARFNVAKELMISKKRDKDLVEARQICIYVMTEMMDIPLTKIGALMGGRDHTTIMHARDKIAEKVENNPRIKILIDEIKSMVLQ